MDAMDNDPMFYRRYSTPEKISPPGAEAHADMDPNASITEKSKPKHKPNGTSKRNQRPRERPRPSARTEGCFILCHAVLEILEMLRPFMICSCFCSGDFDRNPGQ